MAPQDRPDTEPVVLTRLLLGLRDLRDGNFRRRLAFTGGGLPTEIAAVFNELAERNQRLVAELERVSAAAAEGSRPIAPVRVDGAPGGWARAASAADALVRELPGPPAEPERVLGALARGDLAARLPRRADVALPGGSAADANRSLDRVARAVEGIVRVVRELGVEGRFGGRVDPTGLAGTWLELAEAVNGTSAALAAQVRDVAGVTGAVAAGDLSREVTAEARGEMGELAGTINAMVRRLAVFDEEVSRVAREVAEEGRLGARAEVPGARGRWRELTAAVNLLADDLTAQVRDIAVVATAVARGDLTRKVDVAARGEVLQLKNTLNAMVDRLSAFADEVIRVAREVGTEGRLGGQARVPGVAGTWQELTDGVNTMADNLTGQVRGIAQVTTAVAGGDLSKRIDVAARGEILELKTTINTMVDRLSAFADEVTRVAREVGTEGRLGGQAEVADVSGTWRRLTESVNRLAGNLTTQVRAIAEVATAVAEGDLSREITVAAAGEVAELKDDINAMIGNLRETTRANREQDWLKSNLARLSAVVQGGHELDVLARSVLDELVPLVGAQYGAFFLRRSDPDGRAVLERTAGYGVPPGAGASRVRPGESLVGQVASSGRTVLVTDAPPEHVRIGSGLVEADAVNLVVLPVRFEDEVLAVLELAAVRRFAPVHLDLLERVTGTIGVEVNTIVSNSRTEELLAGSQHLAQQLRERSEQLQTQQDELRRSNTELAEKATLLASRNRDIELKNLEIEQARQDLEDRARELSRASAYKSEFLANMSHELRTPLNSVLIMAKLLAEDREGTLTPQQVDLARTIHQAGTDLLRLINDVLDLAKVEAGRMNLLTAEVELAELAADLDALYRPVAEDAGLGFDVVVDPSVPPTLRTDRDRLEQVLRNLLSNAVKFTDRGRVELRVRPASPTEVGAAELRCAPQRVALEVRDTGRGIPEDQLSRVFEAFQQVDATAVREHGGTGLGLSISQELTALLGGELAVRSEPGRGSTFAVFLPTAPPEEEPADEAVVPLRAEPETGVRPRFDGERVLLVDDDERGARALAMLLEQHGLEVVTAGDAFAGISALREHEDVRAVLMDVMMPELDGDAAIRLIREMPRYRELPIIAVTAKAMPADRERSLEAGATDCVAKPVDADALLGLLAEQLRR
ncbi:HAMP domain-containing protein [Saccharopolyspora sp. CA-218241]|uniref:HAMP domain-containing protein n=1 Tax=Saccharopolyspora sp. CA-218241 TaxID=3240027 RepID=UPI003D99578A